MPKTTIIQAVKSVLAAFIGVQSEQNRQRDFSQGSLKVYVIVGIIFTIAFVASLIALVSTILG